MEGIATTAVILGCVIMAIGWILLIVKGFLENVLWGVCMVLIPFVGLLFVILHFRDARGAFFTWLVGVILVAMGKVLGGGGF
jgi:hypothetical protein